MVLGYYGCGIEIMCLNVLLCYKCNAELDSEPNVNEDSETGIVCSCGERDTYTDERLQKEQFPKCWNCEESK